MSLRVRNLSDSARDLVVMFTEDPTGRSGSGAGCSGGAGGGQHQLSLERSAVRSGGHRRGAAAASVGSDSDGDEDGGAIKDISPAVSALAGGV